MKRTVVTASLSSAVLVFTMFTGAGAAMAAQGVLPVESSVPSANEATNVVDPFELKLIRTDNIQNPKAGDRLTFTLRYKNVLGRNITLYPRASNLTKTHVEGQDGGCRYSPLKNNQSFDCTFPYHVVTVAEAAKGTFTPEVTIDATEDREGRQIYKAGMVVKGEPIKLQAPVTLKLERTDNLGNDLMVGDRLSYKLTYTNNTTDPITIFPEASNLESTAVNGLSGGCRWANLKPGTTAECNLPFHVLSKEDGKAGKFQPTVSIKLTTDREGNNVLATLPALSGEELAIKNEERPDPSTIPTERADGVSVRLATDGVDGFKCYRIPALTTNNQGWILAAWDGRPDTCQDAPQSNSIVQRISKDGGKSWEPAQVILAGSQHVKDYQGQKYGYSDPSYVVDRETGEIFVFIVKSFDVGIGASHEGTDPNDRGVLHAVVASSTDGGVTWSEPKIITADITKIPGVRGRFATSGEGIQLRYGAHKGRLLQQYAFWMTGNQHKAVSVYSDDHGKTWKAGEPFGTGMDENKVVELSNGDVMDNSRASDGYTARKISISKDGGETYGPTVADGRLIDPRNNGSIIRAYPEAEMNTPEAQVLLFSNANSTNSRSNGTVKVSFDDGRSWTIAKQFKNGGMSYSTLTPLSARGTYGLLFEPGGSNIDYMHISMDWLGYHDVVPMAVTRDVFHGGNVVDLKVQNTTDQPLKNVKLELPTGETWSWEKPTIEVPEIAPHAIVSVKTKLNVAEAAPEGNLVVPINAGVGEQKVQGSGLFHVKLREGEEAPKKVEGVGFVDESKIPSQPGEGPAFMLDGNPNTKWHSPWNSSVTLPLDIDFNIPLNNRIISATVWPRNEGNNGTPSDFDFFFVYPDGNEVKIGHGGLTDNNSGTFALKLPENIAASGESRMTLRMRIKSTLGDVPNKFASLANVQFNAAQGDVTPYDEALVSKVQSSFEVLTPKQVKEGMDASSQPSQPAEGAKVTEVGKHEIRIKLKDPNGKAISGEAKNLSARIDFSKPADGSGSGARTRARRSVLAAVPSNTSANGGEVVVSGFKESATEPGLYVAESNLEKPGKYTVTVLHNNDEMGKESLIVEPSIVSIDPVNVETKFGVPPQLPGTVVVNYNDEAGTIKRATVTWNQIPEASYSVEKGATFNVEGTVEGTDIKAVATVKQEAKPVEKKEAGTQTESEKKEAGTQTEFEKKEAGTQTEFEKKEAGTQTEFEKKEAGTQTEPGSGLGSNTSVTEGPAAPSGESAVTGSQNIQVAPQGEVQALPQVKALPQAQAKSDTQQLPNTGSKAIDAGLAALMLVVAGGALVAVRRYRKA